MSNEKKAVASALLRGVSSQVLVDAMFAAARPDNLQAPPSDKVALKFYKGDLDHVLAIAADTRTSPEVLGKYAGDTRVSVRETLVKNTSTPESAMEKLARWAAGRDDQSVTANALRRLAPETVVTVLEDVRQTGRVSYQSPLAQVVARKVRGDAELTRRAINLGPSDIAVAILQETARGVNTALTAVETYDLVAAAGHGAQVYGLLENVSELTVDVATMVAKASLATNRRVVGGPEGVTLIEPGSLEALAKGSDECLEAAVALGVSEDALRSMLQDATTKQVTLLAGSLRARKYSAAFENDLVRAAIRHGAEAFCTARTEFDGGSSSVLSDLRHRLPEDTLLAFLREFGWHATQAWLTARPTLVNYPRSGQLDKLAAKPGRAFKHVLMTRTRDTRGFMVDAVRVSDVALENQANGIFQQRRLTEDTRPDAMGNAELARHFDSTIGTHMSWDSLGRFAASRLELALGEQLDAWETVLTLAPGWTSGLEDLINATVSLSGATRKDIDPVEQEVQPVHGEFVQDDLVCV